MRSGLLIAHPDDEAWAFNSPLLAASHRPLPVFCTSRGDAGVDLSSERRSGEVLGLARWGELNASLSALCGDGDFVVEGGEFGDGKTMASLDALRERVGAWADEHALERIVTWGPAGGYGHVDHIACFEVAREVASARGIELWGAVLPAGPALALHQALRRRFRLQIVAEDFSLRLQEERADLVFSVDRELKERALQAHRSQLGDRPVERFVYPPLTHALLHEERFMVLAPPAR